MNKKTLYIILGVVALACLYVWSSYNSFISRSEAVDSGWAQVETQYQRRFDLIPNLVNSVKGILKQEQEVFGKLAEARAKYSGATNINDKVKAASQVESALGRLLVVVENYPQLRSAETVGTLMVQLEGTENRISVERKRYNDLVQSYNLGVKRFPSSFIARLFSFVEKAYFESVSGSEVAPKVEL